jgi:hypothetical protein
MASRRRGSVSKEEKVRYFLYGGLFFALLHLFPFLTEIIIYILTKVY